MQINIKERLDTILGNIDQLPSIPEVASKIINMVNNPNVSFKQIADEIAKDQAMTANILKLSNSAYFSKGKEISSVERAMVILGLKEVKNIVMIIATKPVLDKAIIGYDLDKGALWNHGLLVANMANRIALMKQKKDVADVVFTGGIIHNVGKVVVALYVKTAYKEIFDYVQSKGVPFVVAEKEVMGYSHQEIGERILKKWQFPQVLQTIVRYYSEPDRAPEQHRFEVSAVHIANGLTLMAGIGVGSDGLYHEFNQAAVKAVGITESEIHELFSKIPDMINQMKELQ
jgi:HD-like signal output (HDOD) protein